MRELHRRGYTVLGAVDPAPGMAGRDLGDWLAVEDWRGLPVTSNPDDLLNRNPPEMVVQTTVSSATEAFAQLEPWVRAGCTIVSSCEQMVFPALSAPDATRHFQNLCREHGARVCAAGINPGFLLDLLPILITHVQMQTHSISCRRVVNASLRRAALQRKIGSGLPPEEFQRLFAEGKMGHAGFPESVALIAQAQGWTLDRIEHRGEAVVAREPVSTAHFQVAPGQTRGLHQTALGYVGDAVRIRLELIMALNEAEPQDVVELSGDPPVHLIFHGGVHGDTATVATLCNLLPRLAQTSPGFHLLYEVPGGGA